MYDKKYYEENREKILAYKKEYRLKNKEKIAKARKKYKANNREIIREEQNRWYKKHKEDVYLRIKNRRRTDIAFRIACSLRTRLNACVKYKRIHTMDLVGCSIEDLMKHLESQFQEGMSWDNYGKWHIDHIRPCASFNLLNEDEQKECFHYSNLQPLWAVDNIRKGKKLLDEKE